MIKINPSITCILSIVSGIIFIYLLLTPHNSSKYLFNTILGRTILFALIIFLVTLNQLCGIVISAIILVLYNEYSLEQEQYTNTFAIPAADTIMSIHEPYSNVCANLDTIINKISLEHYIKPKQSNLQFVPNLRYNNEPGAYQNLLKACPYF